MIHDVAQGTSSWLEARLGKPSASRFGEVMARTTTPRLAYATELALERLRGQPTDTYVNKDMMRGQELEPDARLQYMLITKNPVDETGFHELDYLPVGASPDGLIGEDGLLEIKAPRPHNHVETLRKKKVPPQYYWQVMGQMFVTGRTWADFVSYCPEFEGDAGLVIVRIERDSDAIERLEKSLATFLDEIDGIVKEIKEYKRG